MGGPGRHLPAPLALGATIVREDVKARHDYQGELPPSGSFNVIGNVQAEGAATVNVTGNSTVGGSIQIKQGGGAEIKSVRVNGDIQFESNTLALSVIGNRVGGNVQVFQNTGGVTVADNTVDGNLQCKENDPAPVGGNNVVQGDKEDQCALLEGGLSDQNNGSDNPPAGPIRLYVPAVMR